MEVEDVARVSLTSRRTAENQRDFAVGHGLLREVVVDDERMTARVAEILGDGHASVGGVELHGGRVGGGGRDHDGVVHGTVLFQRVHEVGHGGAFLPDGHVDAVNRVAVLVVFLLVDDGVDGDGGLARLAVADDELTLAAPDGDHCVDGLEARLQRLVDGLAEDDARGLALQGHLVGLALDGSLAVDGLAEAVDDAAQHAFAREDGGDALGALHRFAFLDALGGTEQHHADVVFLKVEHHAHGAVLELHQLVRLHLVEAVDVRHAVAHLQHLAHLLELNLVAHVLELHLQDARNFTWFDV